jgi:integrase
MAILAECPICRTKQSNRNKRCKCGEDLDKAKKAGRIKYWITYRLPGGKQRKEMVGTSIEEARDAEGKRRSQKREGRIFDMLPESRVTFGELIDWYLNLKKVKALATHARVKIALGHFGDAFGSMVAADIKRADLEDYQESRAAAGISAATIDMELSIAKTMVTNAFDNDKVDGRALRAFRTVERRLHKGSNARKGIVPIIEFLALLWTAPPHMKAVLVLAYNTGMRSGEIRSLRWSYIDRAAGMIRLPAEVTKENRPKSIPVNHHVADVLDSLPRSIAHDFVIAYNGQPIRSPGGLRRSFVTACNEVGIKQGRDGGIIFHDIRRTVKTNMLKAGVDKVRRDVLLGHSVKGMDAHYIVTDDDMLKDAMAKYTAWLDAQLESVAQNVAQGEKSAVNETAK